jgi:hypothetical protein
LLELIRNLKGRHPREYPEIGNGPYGVVFGVCTLDALSCKKTAKPATTSFGMLKSLTQVYNVLSIPISRPVLGVTYR